MDLLMLNATAKEDSQEHQFHHQPQRAKRKDALNNAPPMEIVHQVFSAVQTGISAWIEIPTLPPDQTVTLTETEVPQLKKKKKNQSQKNQNQHQRNQKNQNQPHHHPHQVEVELKKNHLVQPQTPGHLIDTPKKNPAKQPKRDGMEMELHKILPTTSEEDKNLKTQPSMMNMLSSGEVT